MAAQESSHISRHTYNPFEEELFQIYKANVSDVIDLPGLHTEKALVDLKKIKRKWGIKKYFGSWNSVFTQRPTIVSDLNSHFRKYNSDVIFEINDEIYECAVRAGDIYKKFHCTPDLKMIGEGGRFLAVADIIAVDERFKNISLHKKRRELQIYFYLKAFKIELGYLVLCEPNKIPNITAISIRDLEFETDFMLKMIYYSDLVRKMEEDDLYFS
jgi:hypothetical protein